MNGIKILNSFFLFAFFTAALALAYSSSGFAAVKGDATSPAHYGVASIWNTKQQEQFPHVKTIQGKMLWRDLQPGRNKFNWKVLDRHLQRANSLGKPVMLQINTPIPLWIYEDVPWVGGKSRGNLPPQFWHPQYIKHYDNMLANVAKRIKASKYKNVVMGIRINLNAFNPEAWSWTFTGRVPNEILRDGGTQNRAQWKIRKGNKWVKAPANKIYKPKLDSVEQKKYIKSVLDAYIKHFHAINVPTYVRPWIESEAKLEASWMNQHVWSKPLSRAMGTEFFAHLRKASGDRSHIMRSKARELGRPAYYEDNKDLTNIPGKTHFKPGKGTKNKFQEIYWRQLLKLDMGLTYSATYGTSLALSQQNGFKQGFAFFNKYAGHYSNPEKSPGAWIAFSQFPGKYPVGNLGFYLTQTNLNTTTISMLVNDDYRGYMARKITGKQLSLKAGPGFAKAVKGKKVKIIVTYLDKKGDKWQLKMNNGKKLTNVGVAVTGKINGKGVWAQKVFTVTSSMPGGRNNDLVIQKLSGAPVFHMIEIEK